MNIELKYFVQISNCWDIPVKTHIKIAKLKLAMPSTIMITIPQDGLFLVTENPSCIRGDRNVVLTPNVVEFGRLFKKVVNHGLMNYIRGYVIL